MQPKGWLIIFYPRGGCWEYSLIDNSLIIHLAPEIAYSANKAETEGQDFVARD